MIQPVYSTSRNIGDPINVYDRFNGHDSLYYTGTITSITKAYVTVENPHGDIDRFHRATGFIVGYSFPSYEFAIAPETSK